MCFAPQRRALFRHRNFQKWSEPLVFCTFWLGNVLRAKASCNCFDISTSKSVPSMCFVHFDLEIFFAPQRRALFRHLNFQKWSDSGVFCTFWLGNVLRATTACTFSTSQLPKVSEPRATKPRKNTGFRDFPTFLKHLHLLSSDLFSSDSSSCWLLFHLYCRKFDFQTSFDQQTFQGIGTGNTISNNSNSRKVDVSTDWLSKP